MQAVYDALPDNIKNIYFHLPNVIFNADKVAKGNVKDSYIFGKYLDKLHLTTNIISKENRKAVISKNLFITSKGEKFFKNKEIIGELTPREDRPTSIQPTLRPQSNGGDGSISTLRDVNSLNLPSPNIYKSQVDFKSNIDNSKNDIYRDEAGGKKKREVKITAKSDDPIPPDISARRPGRFDAGRLDETAHAKGYSAEESKKSLGEFLEALEKFTEKIDARMLDLPELLAFAQNIDRVDFRVVKGFKGNWYGVYRSGLTRMGTRVHPKRIELRADLFRALGDLRRYELAEAAAKKTLESASYAPIVSARAKSRRLASSRCRGGRSRRVLKIRSCSRRSR